MTYLNKTVAEENGYTQTIKEGHEYHYKEGHGIWIYNIGALKAKLNTNDEELLRMGYAVSDYYKLCEARVKKEPISEKIELNLFDLNYNTINVA